MTIKTTRTEYVPDWYDYQTENDSYDPYYTPDNGNNDQLEDMYSDYIQDVDRDGHPTEDMYGNVENRRK